MTISYYDKYPMESRVFIDFKNNKVNFEQIIKTRGRFYYAVNVIYPTLASLIYLLLISMFPALVILPIALFMFISINQGVIVGYILTIKIVVAYIFIIYFAPILSIPLSFIKGKGFNEKIFPKLGALSHSLSLGDKRLCWYDIKEKEIIIPSLTNSYISYRAFGEYASKLEKIYVIESPLYDNFIKKSKIGRCPIWDAHFVWEEIPKNGFIIIDYI